MNYQDVRYERKGDVAWVTIARPEVLNAVRAETGRDLRDAFGEAESDTDVRFIVLTGEGRGFCAGDDINATWSGPDFDEHMASRTYDRYREPYEGSIDFILEAEKPVVGMINGVAVGIGMDYAMACDIRVASDQARFGWFYVRRGLLGTSVGLYLLPRIVGLGRAYELMLTGKMVSATDAERMGLVSRIVPLDQLEDATEELLADLRLAAPMSQRAVKRAVRHGLENRRELLDEYAMLMLDPLFNSDDFREAVAAWREKRTPEFHSR